MKRAAFISIITAGILSAYNINVHSGWQFKGALEDLNATALFQNPNIVSVWTYDTKNSKWRVYLPNNPTIMQHLPSYVSPLGLIKKEEGYWVNALGSAQIDTGMQRIATLLSAYVDTPQDFALNDIAYKTFHIYASYGASASPRMLYMPSSGGGENITLAFDGNGVAQVGQNAAYKYDNGWIDIEENGTVYTRFKKLAQDSNGIIAVGIYHEPCEDYYTAYLDPWLSGSLQPVDMEAKLPYTVYDAYSSYEYKVFETNGSITYYRYNDETKGYEPETVSYMPSSFTIENGAIKTMQHNETNYEDYNYTQDTIRTLQIVASIGRYDVVHQTYDWIQTCRDNKLIGINWDDILQNPEMSSCTENIKYILQGGSSSDENVSYTIDGNKLEIIYHYCYQAGTCKERCYDSYQTYLLDSEQGAIEQYEKSDWIGVVSSSPIIKPGRDIYSARKRGRVGEKK